ncbi:MAG: GntR family transcriptional regulator [Chloroflexi bacterium]|nr:GntR family transcriptional regulator [Chloroflexota bacterium]
MTRLAAQTPLYERIAADILRRVASGELRPGDRLPPVRQAARLWGVNLNTVARAYATLSERGVVESRAGGGTVVAGGTPRVPGTLEERVAEARAERLHARLGAAVLEALAGGYAEVEIEAAVSAQLSRWRATRVERVAETVAGALADGAVLLGGSHDLALDVLAARLRGLTPPVDLQIETSDSLDGLFALGHGTVDLAGCHLLDPETGDYNVSFVRRILPGEDVVLATLAHRQQGLIVASGNPKGLRSVEDLIRPGVSMVNRPRGSGTRVLLDEQLRRAGVDPRHVAGYDHEEATHLAVAGAVAAGAADVGLGILAAARAYGLDFVPLVRERYELALRPATAERPSVRALLVMLGDPSFRAVVTALGGYDTSESGALRRIT